MFRNSGGFFLSKERFQPVSFKRKICIHCLGHITDLFEIGGKGKGFAQIRNLDNSYVAAGEIKVGYGNKIPLWMFGMLY